MNASKYCRSSGLSIWWPSFEMCIVCWLVEIGKFIAWLSIGKEFTSYKWWKLGWLSPSFCWGKADTANPLSCMTWRKSNCASNFYSSLQMMSFTLEVLSLLCSRSINRTYSTTNWSSPHFPTSLYFISFRNSSLPQYGLDYLNTLTLLLHYETLILDVLPVRYD